MPQNIGLSPEALHKGLARAVLGKDGQQFGRLKGVGRVSILVERR